MVKVDRASDFIQFHAPGPQASHLRGAETLGLCLMAGVRERNLLSGRLYRSLALAYWSTNRSIACRLPPRTHLFGISELVELEENARECGFGNTQVRQEILRRLDARLRIKNRQGDLHADYWSAGAHMSWARRIALRYWRFCNHPVWTFKLESAYRRSEYARFISVAHGSINAQQR